MAISLARQAHGRLPRRTYGRYDKRSCDGERGPRVVLIRTPRSAPTTTCRIAVRCSNISRRIPGKRPRISQIEFGIRHSLIQPWHSEWRNIAMFNPRFYDARAGRSVCRACPPSARGTWDPIYRNPSAWMWNATAEYGIAVSTTASAGDVARTGLHSLLPDRNMNQLRAGTIQRIPGIKVNALRPFRGYGDVRLTSNEAYSRHGGMQVSLNRRPSRGLGVGVAYTFAGRKDAGQRHERRRAARRQQLLEAIR